jgi:hypothetical protein
MTIHQLPNGHLAIPVPEDAWDFSFEEVETTDSWVLTYKTKFRWEKYGYKNWNWEIQFDDKPDYIWTSESITEEQAAGIVEKEDGYDAYKEYERDGPWVNEKAVDSFHSLLRSLSLGRVAIIKRQ